MPTIRRLTPLARIVAVAASTLLAGIYIYDRAGGDFFGLRAAEPASATTAEQTAELTAEPTVVRQQTSPPIAIPSPHQSSRGLGPMPTWYAPSTVVPDPYPFINQGSTFPDPQPDSVPPTSPAFSQEVPRQEITMPGSKSGVVRVPWIGNQP